MASIVIKMALVAAGLAIMVGYLPGRGLRGGIVAFGFCVAAALIIHVVAP